MQQLTLKEIIASRKPSLAARLPDFVLRYIERMVCLDRINALLDVGRTMQPVEFATELLRRLDVGYSVTGAESLDGNSRVVFASNHPLGGLDGIIMADLLGHRYGSVLLGVNELLMNLLPLRPLFLPICRSGRHNVALLQHFESAFWSDTPIAVFPAGICSRRTHGIVSDPTWQPGFIKRAVASRRDVIPTFVSGSLSDRFYRTASLRKMLGIRYNYEMVLLPSELFALEGGCFDVTFGERISWQTLDALGSLSEQMSLVRAETELLRYTVEGVDKSACQKRGKLDTATF